MTPRELDTGVVRARLALIEQLLGDLEAVGEVTADRLSEDRILRHAVERPRDYSTSFDLAAEAGLLDPPLRDRLKPSVGLRNVLAHEYVAIDLSIVATATRHARTDFRAYVESVARWLREHD